MRPLLLVLLLLPACRCPGSASQQSEPKTACRLVVGNPGAPGRVPVRVEPVASGLEVPWAIAFLPDDGFLVTERPGRVRLFDGKTLVAEPVLTVPDAELSEGGLLGIALHPDFGENRLFYLYRSTTEGGVPTNRVERWKLASDARSASFDRVILTHIAAARYHDGGRIRFGPDRMLYVATGDATRPPNSQDPTSLNGKLLRVDPDGKAPSDNPSPPSPVFLSGVRNVQAFDWRHPQELYVADHGPSGEMGRRGHDEVSLARPGDNLGWPGIWGCQEKAGMVTPSIVWEEAVPPGGLVYYQGSGIPEWRGSLLVATLRSRHLHRVEFERDDPARVKRHEVYFAGEPPEGLGRLREVTVSPRGELLLSTSNCDGRGTCPPEKDRIVRVVR